MQKIMKKEEKSNMGRRITAAQVKKEDIVYFNDNTEFFILIEYSYYDKTYYIQFEHRELATREKREVAIRVVAHFKAFREALKMCRILKKGYKSCKKTNPNGSILQWHTTILSML